MLSRRSLLAGALLTQSCQRVVPRDGKIHLRLSTWGEPAELGAFRTIIERYQRNHSDVAIDLEVISYRTRNQVDTLLAAGLGPDLVRVQFLDVGRYAPSGALIDLSKYLPVGLAEEFTDQTWAAVRYNGRVHALPHHTDTSAIYFNKKIGIRAPESIEQSWHWEEFLDITRSAQRRAHFECGFAVNWTMGGSFRWLNFLFQHGGTLLTEDFRAPALPSSAAAETLAWTRSFFTDKLVPAGDSAQSSEQVENLFATGVVPVYFDIGPQALETLSFDFDYGVTFLPRDKNFAAELGGNAIGVSRDSKHPDVAADFALFLTNEDNMRDFVQAARFLPVRKKLTERPPNYGRYEEEMRIHLEQSKTVPVELARTVTLPNFHRMSKALGDELDMTFTGGQSLKRTQERLAHSIQRAL